MITAQSIRNGSRPIADSGIPTELALPAPLRPFLALDPISTAQRHLAEVFGLDEGETPQVFCAHPKRGHKGAVLTLFMAGLAMMRVSPDSACLVGVHSVLRQQMAPRAGTAAGLTCNDDFKAWGKAPGIALGQDVRLFLSYAGIMLSSDHISQPDIEAMLCSLLRQRHIALAA